MGRIPVGAIRSRVHDLGFRKAGLEDNVTRTFSSRSVELLFSIRNSRRKANEL